MLFESIANSQWFSKSALILFLNKIDLFKKKLVSSPIPHYFPDFVGDHTNAKLAGKFFQMKFKGLNRNPAKVRAIPSLGLGFLLTIRHLGHLHTLHKRDGHEFVEDNHGLSSGYDYPEEPA